MVKPYILVVDDNKITTKLLRRYLEANGFEASEAYDGIECLESVEKRLPDAIILDVMMPRLDGYETAKKLKSNKDSAHVPIVIVTDLNDVANQLKSIECGADDFLSKPIEEKLLIAKAKLLSNLNIERKKSHAIRQILTKVLMGEITAASVSELLAEAGLE